MSFDFFDSYATDENLENNGTNFPFGPSGGTLLVARGGNRAYSKALMKAVELRKVELDADDTGKVSDDIIAGVMAETILLGWTGDFTLREKAGGPQIPLPYSLSNAKRVLAFKDFRKHVSKLADDMDAFKFKLEAEAGNV